jgi:hypothetical protein
LVKAAGENEFYDEVEAFLEAGTRFLVHDFGAGTTFARDAAGRVILWWCATMRGATGVPIKCNRKGLPVKRMLRRAPRQPVDVHDRHHIAGGEVVEDPQKLAAVGTRAHKPLGVDVSTIASGPTQLLNLIIEGLPVGRDAGIADQAFFGMSFGDILRQT